MRDIYPRCRECGYDLTGIGVGEKEAVCPECGEVFDPRSPFMRERWPATGIILARMCWPGWVGGAVAGVVPQLVWYEASDLAVVMVIAAGVLWPIFSAYRMAKRHAHPAEFRLVTAGLAVAGILGALLGAGVVMPIAASLV